ncbi:unnamed protein product [Lactuca saligna]|uniref:Isopropylmalate dehydrogenase-like domain-containing protein n=1 Tax=Lactuca saligna TaxID=75948 RepID=A0AA36EIZ5_LACSI|nr:unnamed protein product [Lactuca saligna]
MPRPGDDAPRTITLIPGDGINPLVTGAVKQVMDAIHAPIYFEKFDVHCEMKVIPMKVIESIKKNKVCLKGCLNTPMGGGVSLLNVQLRKELDLYTSLENCFNLPELPTHHENVDIVVIRENTEGEYAGLGHEVVPGVVESLKVYSNPSIVCFYLDPIFIGYVKKNSKLRILGQISFGLLKKFREGNDRP